MSWFKNLFSKNGEGYEIHQLIKQLKKDFKLHQGVGDIVSDSQILSFEENTGFKIPTTYQAFIKKFGDGAFWLYGCQPIDSIEKPLWLKDIRPEISNQIPNDGNGDVPSASLLCLMTEDSNGGSWCWITTESNVDGENPLVYVADNKTFYKQQTFTDWLRILVTEKQEVIRALDYEKADKLGLG